MPHTEPSSNNSVAHVDRQERGKAYHKMTVRRAGLAILGHGTWRTPLDLRGVDDYVDAIRLCCTAHGLENQVCRRVVACITARIDLQQNAKVHDDPHSSLSRKAIRQAGLRTVTPASTAGIVSQNGRAFERLVAPQYWRTHGQHTQRQDRVMRARPNQANWLRTYKHVLREVHNVCALATSFRDHGYNSLDRSHLFDAASQMSEPRLDTT